MAQNNTLNALVSQLLPEFPWTLYRDAVLLEHKAVSTFPGEKVILLKFYLPFHILHEKEIQLKKNLKTSSRYWKREKFQEQFSEASKQNY